MQTSLHKTFTHFHSVLTEVNVNKMAQFIQIFLQKFNSFMLLYLLSLFLY